MSFVINKKSKKRGKDITLHYLVENYREGKKIKRRTIRSLGESGSISDYLGNLELKHKQYEVEIAKYEAKIKDKNFSWLGGPPWRQIQRMQRWIEDCREKIAKLEQVKEDVLKLAERYPGK